MPTDDVYALNPYILNNGRAGGTMRKRRTALVTVSSLMLGALYAGAAWAQSPVADGEKLAFDRSKGNCLTCHVIAGGDAPGNVAPPLADMTKRFLDRQELFAIIFDETKRNPQTVMPPFGRNLILTNREINDVIDFLYTR
jgi:L-cysteine S-thiosulfotransferase